VTAARSRYAVPSSAIVHSIIVDDDAQASAGREIRTRSANELESYVLHCDSTSPVVLEERRFAVVAALRTMTVGSLEMRAGTETSVAEGVR